MFKELFEAKTVTLYVPTYADRKDGKIEIIDGETGEVTEPFKNLKDLIKTVTKNPRDYQNFFRKTEKELKDEVSKEVNLKGYMKPAAISVDADIAAPWSNLR